MLNTPLEEATIGFVGVGQMGLPMARNVIGELSAGGL